MFGKKQLKELSHICAYCGKALKDEYKTFDHVIPKSAGGTGYANNIVVCCQKCNIEKANQDVETFLAAEKYRKDNFYNYLILIDNQRGNRNYSEQILKKIGRSSYYFDNKKGKKSRTKQEKKKQKNIMTYQPQNIRYNIYGTDVSFKISEIQMKILEFYMSNPEFTDYKELSRKLGLSKTVVLNNIVQINNLTGIFLLKHVSQNGIRMNELFYKYLNIEKTG